MTAFEFLSVLISILLGLGLTHVVGGLVRAIHLRQLQEVHVVYTAFTFMVLVLNWWTFFSWHDQALWRFDDFLLLIFWALSFYLLAVTLYPPSVESAPTHDTHHRWFLWALCGACVLDIAQYAVRGELFTTRYYLPFVLQYIGFALLAIMVRSTVLRRAVAWWFLISIVVWSFVVRRFLA